jgi:hypothetical protein
MTEDKKDFRKKIEGILDDPFESPLMLWPPIIGAAIGLLKGIVAGFLVGGIGGAIAYGLGEMLLGGISGFIVALLLGFFIAALPWLILIGLVLAVIWIVSALWGVGKP